MELLEYLRETSCELAALADKDRFESLAYIFRMAALDADRCMAEPAMTCTMTCAMTYATACAAPALTQQTATILPFRMTDRR
jgi:hypothetical protein